MALIIIVTSATIVGVAYFLPTATHRLQPLPRHGRAAAGPHRTGAGEYSREMLRKPYVIGRWMFSNGVRVNSIARINQEGYLAHSEWTWNDSTSSYSRGEAIFRGECGSCHTLNGYRPSANCSTDATAQASATSSPCSTTTSPTRPTAASCPPWSAPGKTSTTSPTTSTPRSARKLPARKSRCKRRRSRFLLSLLHHQRSKARDPRGPSSLAPDHPVYENPAAGIDSDRTSNPIHRKVENMRGPLCAVVGFVVLG